jgi:hypothetical protein
MLGSVIDGHASLINIRSLKFTNYIRRFHLYIRKFDYSLINYLNPAGLNLVYSSLRHSYVIAACHEYGWFHCV